jgi:phosphoglycerate dehydrogenase-like enzyme
MEKILVTDTLFIFPEHERQLQDAGFEVVRMKGTMNEEELAEAIKGKTGYILGGVETVTDRVIEAADALKVIAFTGADWAHFIPGHKLATQKGIVITNTPGTTMYPVAEFTITLLLAMLRHIFELGGPGSETFMTTRSLEDVSVGIIGLGRIGERMARLLVGLGTKEVLYWNRTRKEAFEAETGVRYALPEEIMAHCDVVSDHIASQAGEFFDATLLGKAKEGQLFIHTGGAGIDLDVLLDRINNHGMRAAFDEHDFSDERFKALPLSKWYSTNQNAGYNTASSLRMASDMTTESVINVIKTGKDQYIVS